MFARISLVVTLLASLLCAWLVTPTRAVPRRDAGECESMPCVKACCAMKACCESGQQQEAPRSPESLAARTELQLAAPSFHVFAMLYVPAPSSREFIMAEEWSGAHAPPPLARSCIQLI
jgi:hypothetical protein